MCVKKKEKEKEKKKLFFTGRSLSSGDTSELGGGDVPPSRATSAENALLHGSLLVVGRYAPRRRNKPLVRGLRHGSTVTWFLSGRGVSARLLAPPLIPKD